MVLLNDVPANELIEKLAEELKKKSEIKEPVWADYVKTGVHKTRPPALDGWWYMRAAAILRFVSINGPIGVSKIRTKYGGKKRMGHKMPHFKKGSGSIARKVLQQLEAAKLIKYVEKDVHKGRIITKEGEALLDSVALSLIKEGKKEVKYVLGTGKIARKLNAKPKTLTAPKAYEDKAGDDKKKKLKKKDGESEQ